MRRMPFVLLPVVGQPNHSTAAAGTHRLDESSMMPSLTFLPKTSQNLSYALSAPARSGSFLDAFLDAPSSDSPSFFASSSFFSSASSRARFWSSASFLSISSTLRTSFLPMTLRILCCCSVSRLTLSGRSSESTTPRTKLRYRGSSSSNSSEMSTLRTYSRSDECLA